MVTKFPKQLFVVFKKVSYLVKLMPKLSIGKKNQQLLRDNKPPEPVHYSQVTMIFDRCLTWLIGGMIPGITYRFPQRFHFFTESEFRDRCFFQEYQNYQQFKEMLEDKDISEKINEVRYYAHPLYRWQLSKYFIHHAFIVFKTENWWWSIERNEDGVTIQRSQHLENVRDRYQFTHNAHNRIVNERTGIELMKTAPGPVNITVEELIERLWKGKQMNLDSKEKNSKHFANYIYNQIFSP